MTIDKQQLTDRVGKIPKRKMEAIFSGIDLILGR
jgi:mRNA-degrading endonuclease toxin of MazEF toxin-antitoxin module